MHQVVFGAVATICIVVNNFKYNKNSNHNYISSANNDNFSL